MAVMGLGHFGYFVKDIEVMKDFWGNFMGMTLTKSSEGAAFYSADPEGVDHEIAVMQGRPEADDSHLIQQISLRVESLDNVLDPRSGTILLRARVPNSDGRLVPGLFVRMRVPVSDAAPALLVDERAVGTEQNLKFVYAIGAGNIAEFRQVKLGPMIDGKRVIRSGLNAGDSVVVTGLQRVRPGAPVTPQAPAAVSSTAPAGQ